MVISTKNHLSLLRIMISRGLGSFSSLLRGVASRVAAAPARSHYATNARPRTFGRVSCHVEKRMSSSSSGKSEVDHA